MTLSDATLALLLAARIHGTDAAVRVIARRCAKLLPRSKRDVLYQVVESRIGIYSAARERIKVFELSVRNCI